MFWACPSGKRLQVRPWVRWRDNVSRLVWERLGIPPGGAGGSGSGQVCLGFLPEASASTPPDPDKRLEKGQTDVSSFFCVFTVDLVLLSGWVLTYLSALVTLGAMLLGTTSPKANLSSRPAQVHPKWSTNQGSVYLA